MAIYVKEKSLRSTIASVTSDFVSKFVSKFALTNKLVERLTINDEREISKAFMKICGQLLFPRNGYRPRPAT